MLKLGAYGYGLCLVAGLLLSPHSAMAGIIFSDTEFSLSDYTLTTELLGNGGSASAAHEPSGGSPDAYLSVTNVVNTPGLDSSIVRGYHMNNAFTYDPSVEGAIGAIDFSFDARTLAGVQVGIGLSLEQNGAFYYSGYSFVQGADWVNRDFTDLRPSDFGPGLDFSGSGSEIRFGLFIANSQDAGFSTGYAATSNIDNLLIRINPTQVTEPNSIFLAAIGLAGFARFRHRKQAGA